MAGSFDQAISRTQMGLRLGGPMIPGPGLPPRVRVIEPAKARRSDDSQAPAATPVSRVDRLVIGTGAAPRGLQPPWPA